MEHNRAWIVIVCLLLLTALIGCTGSCASGSNDPATTDTPQNDSAEPIGITEDEVITAKPGSDESDLPTVPPETSQPEGTEPSETQEPGDIELPTETKSPADTATPGSGDASKNTATPSSGGASASPTQKPTATPSPTPSATPKSTPTPTPKPTYDDSGDIELPELP